MIPSLRDELTGASRPGLPPFVLLLPRGWVSVEPTREAFADLTAKASAVLRSAHRPDLDAQFRSMLGRAADEFPCGPAERSGQRVAAHFLERGARL